MISTEEMIIISTGENILFLFLVFFKVLSIFYWCESLLQVALVRRTSPFGEQSPQGVRRKSNWGMGKNANHLATPNTISNPHGPHPIWLLQNKYVQTQNRAGIIIFLHRNFFFINFSLTLPEIVGFWKEPEIRSVHKDFRVVQVRKRRIDRHVEELLVLTVRWKLINLYLLEHKWWHKKIHPSGCMREW